MVPVTDLPVSIPCALWLHKFLFSRGGVLVIFFSYHPLNLSWVYYLIRLTEISRSEGVPLLSTGFKDFVSPLDFCLIHETKFVLAHRRMREYREESWSPNRQTPEGELILADTEVNPAKISRAWPTSGELPSQLIG